MLMGFINQQTSLGGPHCRFTTFFLVKRTDGDHFTCLRRDLILRIYQVQDPEAPTKTIGFFFNRKNDNEQTVFWDDHQIILGIRVFVFFQMGLFEGISVHICSYIIKWDFFDWKRQWDKKKL